MTEPPENPTQFPDSTPLEAHNLLSAQSGQLPGTRGAFQRFALKTGSLLS